MINSRNGTKEMLRKRYGSESLPTIRTVTNPFVFTGNQLVNVSAKVLLTWTYLVQSWSMDGGLI